MAPEWPWDAIAGLAAAYWVSRTTIALIAAAGERVLLAGLAPGRHGPQPVAKRLRVEHDRLVRRTVVLTEAGVSQRDTAAVWRRFWTAACRRVGSMRKWPGWRCKRRPPTSAGNPNLVVVGNDSLCIYALMRQPACDGESWGCVPLDAPDCPPFASDAGYRLAAGAQLAAIPVHQLDRDHLLRPLWGQVWRLEQQAYAALAACEDREHKYEQSSTPQRSAHHLIAWEWLTTEAEALIARYNAFDALPVKSTPSLP